MRRHPVQEGEVLAHIQSGWEGELYLLTLSQLERVTPTQSSREGELLVHTQSAWPGNASYLLTLSQGRQRVACSHALDTQFRNGITIARLLYRLAISLVSCALLHVHSTLYCSPSDHIIALECEHAEEHATCLP